ncbi:MAG: anaerobic ribonucleoside-triphosphate reductase [Pseudomonadota bacterium]
MSEAIKLAQQETTDLALFVRTSAEEMAGWDRSRIVNALLRETGINRQVAEEVAKEVEAAVFASGINTITSPLIREMVNARLIGRRMETARRRHTRLGVPIYDVERMILHQNKENANIPHGPEATNLTLAEGIKKEYALLRVFSDEVADAHMSGDFHLHDLGFVDRPYCCGQSLEYVKKFGLNLPNSLAMARPARHPEVLLGHMVKFSAALQSHFAGAIGWDAVNLFFAPYLEGLSDRDVFQLAQMLVFEYSQQAVARGGQAIFSDINLYWEVPKHFANTPAIGPGGKYTGRTYADYASDAQRFVKAIFEVYAGGDGAQRPFFFPKPLVHITEKFFSTPGHEEFLDFICQVAADKGNTYFIFDRGETAKISECCRLSFKLEKNDLEDARTPWKMRYCALQNVTINLPRLAYLAEGSEAELLRLLTERVDLAAQAHREKRLFIEELLSHGESGPLALLAMDRDGSEYLRLGRATYLIGMVGLNEMVQYHLQQELHDGKEAVKFGLRIIAHMKLLADRMSQRHGMRFVLEQTPAESTAYRFAKLDLQHHCNKASSVVKGNLAQGEVYYTNSTLFNVSATLNPIDRVRNEGVFHPLIEAGALSHIWLGESQPSAASLASFVIKTFRMTKNDQITFSPEFTTCRDCGRTSRGIRETCVYCGSTDCESITRITGYFTRVSSWNKGKIGELRDRHRTGDYFASPRAEGLPGSH